ncbi:hypothetical protein HPB52_022749 [Rhipicephalus sanguineus]|uniref:Endonuclease/exonuclease/phosphatase domain-containing protein n=1 Tax=Rhipicephalus sanguineus TaxID=34632 RepID=A0A9D4QC66_RHISA|nr:hypothetical protein HPB52_022749 [Rhipicephalus sanguineus]
MGRKADRKAGSGSSSQEWVFCVSCEVWVDLECTPFETVEEARAAPAFTCRQCEKIDTVKAEMAALVKQQADDSKLLIANLEARFEREINAYRSECEALRVTLQKEREDKEGSTTECEALRQALQQEEKLREILRDEIAALRLAFEEMTACRPAAAPSGTAEAPRGDGTASHEDGAANASSSGGTVKAAGEPEKTPPTHRGGTGNVRTKPKTRAKRRPGTNCAQAQTAKSDVVRGGHEETSLQGREEQDLAGPKDQVTPGAALKRHLEKLGASAQQDRRAFVYGDGNAARLKRAALKAVGWNKRVMFRVKEGASLQELCSSVDLAEDIWQTPAAIVVLHAGSLEMSDGSSAPESSASQLRALLTKWLQKAQGHRFVVYALTERGSGSETHINPCREWNVAVRKMCEELGPRVEFVGASWRLGHGQQGPSYRDDTADQLGQRLGRRLCAFLGLRMPTRHWGPPSQSHPAAGTLMTALGQAIIQMAEGQHPHENGRRRSQGGPHRHTRKRRRCRRKGKQDMVFYLNLQGGRKEAKWEELFLLLQKENVTVACLTETHLRDEETPPPNRQFVWSGLNRTKGERKGGGLGFLTKVDTQWDRVQRDCKEHMWLTGEIGGIEIALGLVYLWTGREVHQRNTETLACLEKDITQMNRPVVVVGDFNAHIEALDGTTDRAGRLLLEWTERLGLTLLNATEKCMGRITWAVRGMSSCIDYCFLSPVLLPKLSYMSIDSTGERSLGSDHHSIFLSFGTNPPETKRDAHAGNLRPLSDEALERVVDQLEEDAPRMEGQGYEELQQWIRRTIQDEAGAGRVTRGRHRRKAWWDGEVAEALAQRKQCCRRHRHALGRGADEAELSALWSLYLEAKKEMASMVQRKMSTVNRKLLRAIKEAGRDSSKKFWQHIKAQQTNSDLPSHQLRDPESGRVMEGEECLHLIRRGMASKLQSTDSGTSAQGATGATNDSSALARALGFRGSGEPPSWEAVEATKRRLECWWRKQVEQTRAPRR